MDNNLIKKINSKYLGKELDIFKIIYKTVLLNKKQQKEIEEILHGMNARIFQHENEHMNGYVFTDLVSKFKLERAKESRKKMLKKYARGGAIK